jgi:predicted transglutaminase-like protease
MKCMRLFVKKQPCLIIFSTFWQENLELYLRQYPSLYLLLSTVCCLVLLVSKWGFSFYQVLMICILLLQYCSPYSFRGAVIFAIHKHELNEKPFHHWRCLLSRLVCP